MKLYIATKYGRLDEARELAATLRGVGHEVTSSWHEGEPEPDTGIPGQDLSPAEQAKVADKDLRDVCMADGLVLMTMARNATVREAGCHFEAGYAHALSMPIFVLGPASTCFYHKFPLYVSDDELVAGIAEYEDEKARQEAEHAKAVALSNKKREAEDASRRDILLNSLGQHRIME